MHVWLHKNILCIRGLNFRRFLAGLWKFPTYRNPGAKKCVIKFEMSLRMSMGHNTWGLVLSTQIEGANEAISKNINIFASVRVKKKLASIFHCFLWLQFSISFYSWPRVYYTHSLVCCFKPHGGEALFVKNGVGNKWHFFYLY